MAVSSTPPRICSSLTVCKRWVERRLSCEADHGPQGLSEQLFEKLTSSPAEPFLKELRELFINFWGKRAAVSQESVRY